MAASRAVVCLVSSALGLATFFAGGAQVQDRVQSLPPGVRRAPAPHAKAAHRFLAERNLDRGLGPSGASPAAQLRDARQQRQLLPNTSNSTSTPAWIPAGPAQVTTSAFGSVTGRITSVAADPSDTSGNTVYFGSTGGGVWKSTNAKTGSPPVFTPLTDDLSAFTQNGGTLASLSIGALTVQPGQTGVLLAGTGDTNDALDSYYGVGILRSADNGNTWSLIPGSSDGYSGGVNYDFTGEGFAGFAWSTANPQLVVAAVSQSLEGSMVNAQSNSYTIGGLYYSEDAGVTWLLGTIEDQGGQVIQSAHSTFEPPGNPASAVVWNAKRQSFYAAVQYHGYYASTDGITWTRLVNQPGANLSTTDCPTNPGGIGNPACPIFRGALAVQPVTGDMFALTVDVNNGDQGLFQDKCSANGLPVTTCASSTVAFGTQLNSTPFEASNGSIPQADYNLALAALSQQQDTIVLVGSEDVFRCSLANSCAWRNTTNVNSCASAAVAPSEHAFESTFGSSGLVYFGNDGGLWRTTDAVGETGSVCASTDATHYQNLNPGIGSLAETPHFAISPTNSAVLLASIGEFGTVAAESAASESAGSTAPWQQVLTGEGGFVAIDPTNPQNWYTDAGAGVTIHRCTSGTSCNAAGFGSSPAIGRTQVDADADYDYVEAPWILDPFNTANMLVGTCRVWRGPATGSGWSSSNLLSPMLDGNQQPMCTSNAILRSLAASGNLPAASGSERVYAGMYGTAINGSDVQGHLYASTVTQSSGLFTWTDLANSPVTNNTSSKGQFNPGGFTISSIAVDPHDSTGKTVYAAVQGFPGNGINSQLIYRSTDGGAHWLDVGGGLPIAPVNSIVVDPNQASVVYVATDAGVYVTQSVTSCATQNCWAVYGTGLPNAPITELQIYNNGSSSLAMASTYGRGIWKIGLLTAPQVATATLTPTSLTFAAQALNTASAAQAITLLNTGSVALTIASIATSSEYSESNNCGSSLAAGATCSISVTFTPTATGSQTGVLTVSANVNGGQITAALNGSGLAPGVLTLSPTSVTFAATVIGQTTAAQAVSATNTGATAIQLGTPALVGNYAFSSDACASATLAPNASCTMQITFTPTASGDRPGTLSVPSNLSGPAPTVSLDSTGLAPAALTLSPSPVAFPLTAVGATSSAQAVTVLSSGGVAVQLGTPATSSGYNVVSSTCGATLAPSATCTLQITFVPTANGSQAGLLTVPASNISGGQATDALTGTGAAPPSLTLSPSPVSFPSTVIGAVSSAQTVTVTAGGGVPTQLGTPSVSAQYKIASTTCGATLASGNSCTIAITFNPSAAGAQPGTLTIPASNIAGGSVTDTLSGTGLTPAALTLSPSSLTFATTATGTTAAAQAVTVTSSGGVTVQLGTPSTTAHYAVASSTCGATLAPSATCVLQITFSPTAVGTVSGTLTVPATNIANGSVTAALSGTGATAGTVALSPASSSFGSVAVGAVSAPNTFTATNSGGVAVTLATPTASAGFTVESNTCSSTLAAGGSCTIQVSFTPSTTGSQTGTLTLSGSAATATATLSGTGVAPAALSFVPSPVIFTGTAVGAASPAVAIALSNTGGVVAQLGTPSATSGFLIASTNCGATLLAGASCTTSVTFNPTASGSISGTLTFPSTSISSGQATDALSGMGLAPAALTLTPSSYNFGSVALGSASAAQSFVVMNTGGVAAQLSSATVTGDYSLGTTTCGSSLAAGGNCSIAVSFVPKALGTRSGVLTVPASNISGGMVTAALTGTGVTAAAFTAAPASLEFGSVVQGASSSPQTVTLTNTGGVAIQLGTPSVSTTDYQISSNTCGATLALGAQCTLQILFHPAATGDRPATLSIPSNLASSPATVALDGTGLSPAALLLAPGSLTFPPAAIGVASAAQGVTVTNTGGVPVQLSSFVAAPADYQVSSNSCGSSLAASASCVVQIVFTPAQVGARPGSLTIAANVSGGSVAAVLNGTGLAPGTLALSPSSDSFGAVVVGAASASATFTATNSGGVAVTLQPPSATGDFKIVSTNCQASLSPGFSCSVVMDFSPSATGSESGTLSIAGGFAASPATAALSGTGVAPGNLTLSPASQNFGSVVIGATSASVTFTGTNSGGAAVSLQAPVISGPFAITSSTCGASLAPSSTCVVSVDFSPTSAGASQGVLSISGNFAASPASATLAGTGLAPGNVTFSPTSAGFGTVTLGSKSPPVSLTATNIGGVAATLQMPSATGDFSVQSTTCAATLAPSGTCVIAVVFAPTTAGARSGTLSLAGNFAASPATAALSGTGVTPGTLSLAPTSISFGSVVLNNTAPSVIVTAANSGGAPVTLAVPIITGDFAIAANTCSASLAAASNCTIAITFTPTATGSRTGALAISGSFAGSPASVALSGTGVAAGAISFTPTTLSFGGVVVGSTGLATIAAINTGGVGVALQPAVITTGYSVVANACTGTLAPAASCQIKIAFTPSATGSQPGTLTLPGNFPASPATAALTGTGLAPGNLTLSPTSLSFGTVIENTTSTPATITASNTGGAAVTVQSSVVTSSYKILANTCNGSIAAGATCSLSIAFAPTGAGDTPGLLTIVGSVPGGQTTASLDGVGIAPGAVTFSPAQLAYGSVVEGTSATMSTTVMNAGGTAVQVSGIFAGGDYSVAAKTCGSSLAAGASCTITVTFTPSAAGVRSGVLSVAGNFPSSPATAALNGTGLAPGALALSPTSIQFGSIVDGQSSSPQSATLSNTGGALIAVPSPTITGDYKIASNNCGSTLAASSACTIGITFSPSAPGDRPGALSVTGASTTVALDGTGLAPSALSLSPTSLSFGSVADNSVSPPQTISVTNTGGSSAQVQTPILTSGYQLITNNCGSTLAVGASCSLQIAFAPTTVGDIPGMLTLLVAAPGTGAAAKLDGAGLAPPSLVLNPGTLTFVATPVGSASVSGNVTVSNTGTVSIPLATPQITGDFALSANSCGATLAANTGCTLSVTFTPSASGTRVGTLTVSSGSVTETTLLSGTGIAPATDTLTPISLTFAAQTVGTVSPVQPVTLTNSGDATLHAVAVSVSGPFTATNNCGGTVAGHASCGIAVAYVPTLVGVQTGILTVTDATRTQTVALSGTGSPPPTAFLAPSQIAFGGYAVGSTTPAQTVTVTNNGEVALAGVQVTLTGSAFSLPANNCPSTLAPGAQCTFTVAFSPPQVGGQTGQVAVTSATLAQPLVVNLSGSGEDFQLSVSGAATAVLTPGQSTTFQVVATPTGTSSGTLTMSCSGAPANSTCTVNPVSLQVANGTTGTAVVTLTTNVTAAGLQAYPLGLLRAVAALALLAPVLCFRRGARRAFAIVLLAAGLALVPTACGVHASAGLTGGTGGSGGGGSGGGGTQTPPGSYTITVTGSFPGAQRTATFTLVVQ